MTDNHIDEKLIASFFEAHQIGEIEDRGFSRRVMRRLPESRMRRLNTVWTLLCMVAVVVYFIMQQGTKVLLVALTHLWSSLSETCCGEDFWGVSCLEKCAKVYLGRLLYGAIAFIFI